MALTKSTMLEIGTPAPGFQLPDVMAGRRVSPETFAAKKCLLVMFISRHCPYVRHVRDELARVARDYSGKSVGIVAVSSNYVMQYPEDAPDRLRGMAVQLEWNFPICYDETQETAKAYGAACTPDFFLFDESRRLVYRGQLDDSRPGNPSPVTGRDLRQAVDAVLSGQPVDPDQKPSTGCSIKWRPGNEPDYSR